MLSPAHLAPTPLLPLVSRGDDQCAALYLARVAASYRGGVDGLAYRETVRHLEHLAHALCRTPKPAPRHPAGLPKLHPVLSRVPFARITPAIALALREVIYANVAAGPKRPAIVQSDAPGEPLRRREPKRPAGWRAAHQRTQVLRGALRAAFESGAMPADRYLACHAALRGA